MELEKENVVPPDENVAEPVAKRAKLDTSVKKQNGDNQKEIVVVDLCDTDSEEDLEEAIRRSLSDPKESSEGASAIAMPNVAESHMVSFPTSYLKDTQSSNSSPDITNSSIDSIYDEDEQVKNALILSCSKSDQPEVVSSKNNDTEEDVKPKALLDTFEDEDDEAKPDSAPFSSHITIDTDDETDQPLACPSSALTSRTKTFRPAINLADLSDSDDDDFVVPEASPFAAKVTIKRDKGLTRFSSDPDKALQILLWKLGFGDTLHVHQTMAVRRVAGVPEDFPLHKQSKATLQSMDLTLAAMGLPEPSTKGILLADEMGIGKTIESIAGMILVNALETYKTGKQRPSVIIVPNTAVLEQWIEALKRNGVRRDRIHKFEKSKILRND
jgi:SNF2 family DNA or RNA helicase